MNDIEVLEYIIEHKGTCPSPTSNFNRESMCKNCIMKRDSVDKLNNTTANRLDKWKREYMIHQYDVGCSFYGRMDRAKEILLKIKIQELQRILK